MTLSLVILVGANAAKFHVRALTCKINFMLETLVHNEKYDTLLQENMTAMSGCRYNSSKHHQFNFQYVKKKTILTFIKCHRAFQLYQREMNRPA
jgi:hypothetical protein